MWASSVDDSHDGKMPAGRTDNSKRRVADLGEYGLIDRLARLTQQPHSDPFQPPREGEINVGDDAAIWLPERTGFELLTTDALVEGVHFTHETTNWNDLGWKSLAVNLSDVAAMGGRPVRAFVTLGLRPETDAADVEALYSGMQELAAAFGPPISGGDTVAAPLTLISITVVGHVETAGLRRSGGSPGDLLAVTNELGASAGGLELLQAREPLTADDDVALVQCHRRPWPRIAEGRVLADAGVRCGMDLSDGLLADAAKLAYASGVGITLERAAIPVHAALQRRFGDKACDIALAGGEDYELLVAAPAEVLKRASDRLMEAGLSRLHVIGELTAGTLGHVRLVDADGADVQPSRRPWDHFSHA